MLIKEVIEQLNLDTEQIKEFTDVIEVATKTKKMDRLEEFFQKNLSELETEDYNKIYDQLSEDCLNDSFGLAENCEETKLKQKLVELEEEVKKLNKSLEEKEMKKKYMEQACPHCSEKKMYEKDDKYMCEACGKKSHMEEGKLVIKKKEKEKEDVKESTDYEKGIEDFNEGTLDNDLLLESEEYRKGVKSAKELQEANMAAPLTAKEFREFTVRINKYFEKFNKQIALVPELIGKELKAEKPNTGAKYVGESEEEKEVDVESLNEKIEELYEGNIYEDLKEKGFKEIFEAINEKAQEKLEEAEYKTLILTLAEQAKENGEEIDLVEFTEEESEEDKEVDESEENNEAENLEEQCNNLIEENIKDLVETDKSKVKELIEAVEFDTIEELEKSLKDIIENLDKDDQDEEEEKKVNIYEVMCGIKK